MTRPLIVATACSLLAAYLTGCGVVCRGPACADEWDVGRAAILPGGADRVDSADAIASADRIWLGTAADGAEWTMDGGDGQVLVGTPGLSRVWALPADGEGALLGEPWTDGTTFGFGRAIHRDETATWVGNPESELASGAVYRYPLGASEPDLAIRGSSTGDRLGERVWSCADLDGDGLPELAASIPWFLAPAGFPLAEADEVPALAGAVLLALSTELAADPARPLWELGRLWWGAAAGDAFGAGVSCDRDLDGDDVPDLAIGAPFVGAEDDGALYLFPGAELPASGDASVTASATVAGADGAWLGFDLGTVTEARSGRTLLVAGAPGAAAGAGAVWILDLANPVAPVASVLAADDAPAGSHVGRFVTHGDTDGDGADDLLVGAPDWKEGSNGYDAGRVLVLYGGSSWFGRDTLVADTTWTASQPFARIGRGLRAVDLDGDGADELLLPSRTAILP